MILGLSPIENQSEKKEEEEQEDVGVLLPGKIQYIFFSFLFFFLIISSPFAFSLHYSYKFSNINKGESLFQVPNDVLRASQEENEKQITAIVVKVAAAGLDPKRHVGKTLRSIAPHLFKMVFIYSFILTNAEQHVRS